jgi:hypothetical protein
VQTGGQQTIFGFAYKNGYLLPSMGKSQSSPGLLSQNNHEIFYWKPHSVDRYHPLLDLLLSLKQEIHCKAPLACK